MHTHAEFPAIDTSRPQRLPTSAAIAAPTPTATPLPVWFWPGTFAIAGLITLHTFLLFFFFLVIPRFWIEHEIREATEQLRSRAEAQLPPWPQYRPGSNRQQTRSR
jgi:hypothetical protein